MRRHVSAKGGSGWLDRCPALSSTSEQWPRAIDPAAVASDFLTALMARPGSARVMGSLDGTLFTP
jgi:hypothetical protein